MANNSRQDKKGLLLGDQLIQRITGPMRVTILKPPSSPPFSMPPILLFGDVHFSIEGECADCMVNDGCYRISEDAFFQALDRVSTKDAPIDFYIESYMKDIPNSHRIAAVGEIQRATNSIRRCAAWNKSKKQRYRRNACPTETVRYHYGDLRQTNPDQDEGAYFEYIMMLMHKNPKVVKEKILSFPSDHVFYQLGKPIIDAFDAFNGYDMTQMPDPVLYSNLMYRLITRVSPRYSRIRKQFNKRPKGFPPEWIVPLIYHSILYLGDRRYISGWLMDVYTILRVFKMSEGPPAALTVMYFGNSHVNTLTRFLRDVVGYDTVYHDEMDDANESRISRCLVFKERIDLQPLLRIQQGGRRMKHRRNTKKLNNANKK